MSECVLQNPLNALVALGSNQVTAHETVMELLVEAVARLSERGVVIRSVSRFFSTPCFPAGAGPDFVNAAFEASDVADPAAFLSVLHEVEAEFGRAREQRWGQRTLDLDLIAVGDLVLPDAGFVQQWMDLPLEDQVQKAPDQMILPHPRVQDRSFVLVPLMDIAPDWVHPLSGLSVKQMHDALPLADRKSVKPLDNLENHA